MVIVRPEAKTKQGGNGFARQVAIAVAHLLRGRFLPRKVPLNEEGNVLRGRIAQREAEESTLGLEVSYLQKTMELCRHPFARKCQVTFSICHGKELNTLKIVEFR